MPTEDIRRLLAEKRPIERDEAVRALNKAIYDIDRMLRFASNESDFPALRRLKQSYLHQIAKASALRPDDCVEIDLYALHFDS